LEQVAAHHQDVLVCIYSNWYMSCVYVGWLLATKISEIKCLLTHIIFHIFAKITLNVYNIFRFLYGINVCIVTYDTTKVRRYIFSHTVNVTDTFCLSYIYFTVCSMFN
jgi:hypothetical protein